jgi:hypothetical protein
MRKTTKFSLGSVVVAGALGAVLMPAASASATEGFACPENTDTIEVPYGYTADNTPELAGTVCVLTGTTVFDSMNISDGWSAELKSDGSRSRTEVRFSNLETRDRVELRYEPGRTEIK